MKKLITLADFEIRYKNILKKDPKRKRCSVAGCKNPRDFVPLLGQDTCCAYHRLLFDFWSADVYRGGILEMTRKGRRRAFTNWRNKTGKAKLDKIVLRMACEPINWVC